MGEKKGGRKETTVDEKRQEMRGGEKIRKEEKR